MNKQLKCKLLKNTLVQFLVNKIRSVKLMVNQVNRTIVTFNNKSNIGF